MANSSNGYNVMNKEEWEKTRSYFEIVVPEIGADFFTGGRPTTHDPDSGLRTISSKYAKPSQEYLSGMSKEANRLAVRYSLQAHYMMLASDKTMKAKRLIDTDYSYIFSDAGYGIRK